MEDIWNPPVPVDALPSQSLVSRVFSSVVRSNEPRRVVAQRRGCWGVAWSNERCLLLTAGYWCISLERGSRWGIACVHHHHPLLTLLYASKIVLIQLEKDVVIQSGLLLLDKLCLGFHHKGGIALKVEVTYLGNISISIEYVWWLHRRGTKATRRYSCVASSYHCHALLLSALLNLRNLR